MATLYTEQSSNVRKTVFIFTLFLGLIIGGGWIFSRIYGNPSILFFAVIFSSVMSITSYWFSDKIVLSLMHAKEITHDSARELYHLVENLCIAGGLPVPKIYIINEPAPNAFATGRNKEHAVVAVTSGLLQKLNKTELEGVIAHELSHIANRDTLISTVAIILVGFISLISDAFMRSTLWRSFSNDEDNRGGQAGMVMFLIGIAFSILAPLIATLMQLAISRKREFLADASGALLTRYPEGLASALEKISRDETPLPIANNTTAHLWFDDPFDKPGKKISWLHKIFMTHPPVEERIARLRNQKK